MTRTHVVLSEEVVSAIDAFVGATGRSRFLEEAAREKLERIDLEVVLQAAAGVLTAREAGLTAVAPARRRKRFRCSVSRR